VGISEADDVEYFWITDFGEEGDGFRGVITNTPRLVKRVESGQVYRFKRSEIVDWVYRDSQKNKMYGNFTACALLSREAPAQAAEFRKQYGLDCDT
jgi:uncharacterized protein YegJ (DUF2314 family)